jgi:DNA ligase (NAD+)
MMKFAANFLLIIVIMASAVTDAGATDREAAQKRIQQLSAEITRHDYLYYVLGKPEISNEEYDRLFDELLRLEKEFPDLALPDSPTKRVGSQLDNTFPHIKHESPMLSLEKCYTPDDMIAWAEDAQKQAGKKLSFAGEEKIDGTAVELVYKDGIFISAATRGNGITGYDVTANARTIRSLPLKLNKPVSVTVRGEVFVRKSDFADVSQKEDTDYDNPRNLAAGALRKKHSSDTAKIPLDIFAFEAVSGDIGGKTSHGELLGFLNELGFKTNPNNQILETVADIRKYIENARSRRSTLDYDIDGIVIKVNETDAKKILGTGGRFPRWALAYKFKSPQDETLVEGIELQVGRLGRITPVAILVPVQISGAEISRATLHHEDYINTLELAVGDTVKISRRGGVIPSVDEVVEKNTLGNGIWQMPQACPKCDTPLKKDGKYHLCPNPDCPAQIIGRLLYFSKKMGIKYLGPKTMEKLVSQKQLQEPEDIYSLNVEYLEGFGEKKTASFKNSLAESKQKPFHVVLSALGIRNLGPRTAKILAEKELDSVEKILEAGTEGLSQVKGIGDVTAERIISGFTPRMLKTVEALKKQGLNL